MADLPACLHAGRPVHHQAVAGAAEVRGDLLGPLVRRVHGQRPAHRVHGVGHRPADLVDPGVHVGDVVGDPVTDEVLADGALGATLAGGAVVPEQVDQEGVVEDAELCEGVDQPADLHVGVLGEPGVGLHEPDGHALGVLVELVPVRHSVRPGRQLGVGADDAEPLLAFEDLLAHGVPAGVEPTLVPLDPLGRDVQRRMGGAEGHVGEEGPLRGQRLLGAHPVHGVVEEILGQVVALLGQPVGFDGGGTGVELGVPVVHLGAHEAVEGVEAFARRPPGERTGGGHLHRRGLVPLAERGRAPTVAAQDLCEGSGAGRPVAGVAGVAGGHLRGDTHPDRVVVAAGHQRLARGRAQRGDVEAAVPQPVVSEPFGGRELARPAVRAGRAEAHVVHDDHDHVGSPGRGLDGFDRESAGVEGQVATIWHGSIVDPPMPWRRITRRVGRRTPVCSDGAGLGGGSQLPAPVA